MQSNIFKSSFIGSRRVSLCGHLQSVAEGGSVHFLINFEKPRKCPFNVIVQVSHFDFVQLQTVSIY